MRPTACSGDEAFCGFRWTISRPAPASPKRALYQHFRSKDDLVAAALSQCSEMALQRLDQFQRAATAAELIDTFFADLAEWAARPRWSGGGFTRVSVELADLRGHPARAIARKHKAVVEAWLADALSAAKVVSARERAREIMLLMEGAMALMLIHGTRDFAKAAAVAAKALVCRA
jgi:AcrR family transcriptional regulator